MLWENSSAKSGEKVVTRLNDSTYQPLSLTLISGMSDSKHFITMRPVTSLRRIVPFCDIKRLTCSIRSRNTCRPCVKVISAVLSEIFNAPRDLASDLPSEGMVMVFHPSYLVLLILDPFPPPADCSSHLERCIRVLLFFLLKWVD